MEFYSNHLVGLFEKLCDDIHSVGIIKGLVLDLSLNDDTSSSQIPAEKVREVLRKYPEIRNIRVLFSNRGGSINFVKMDGEKEQFVENYDFDDY